MKRNETASKLTPSVAKKNPEKLLREVFSKFLGHVGAPMHKKKIGDIEISLLSNFQLGATLGAQKNEKNENCGNGQNICKNR